MARVGIAQRHDTQLKHSNFQRLGFFRVLSLQTLGLGLREGTQDIHVAKAFEDVVGTKSSPRIVKPSQVESEKLPGH